MNHDLVSSINDTPDGVEDDILWINSECHISQFDSVQKILPKNKSWNEAIILYGNHNSTCIEILSDENGWISSVSFRIDFSNQYEVLLSQIIEFCLINGLGLIGQDLIALPLNVLQIKQHIESSKPFKIYHHLLKG